MASPAAAALDVSLTDVISMICHLQEKINALEAQHKAQTLELKESVLKLKFDTCAMHDRNVELEARVRELEAGNVSGELVRNSSFKSDDLPAFTNAREMDGISEEETVATFDTDSFKSAGNAYSEHLNSDFHRSKVTKIKDELQVSGAVADSPPSASRPDAEQHGSPENILTGTVLQLLCSINPLAAAAVAPVTPATPISRMYCLICDKNIPNSIEVQPHYESNKHKLRAQEYLNCSICKQKFNNETTAAEHYKSKIHHDKMRKLSGHPDNTLKECVVCKKPFTGEQNAVQHYESADHHKKMQSFLANSKAYAR